MPKVSRELQPLVGKTSEWDSIIEKARNHQAFDPEIKAFFQILFREELYPLFVPGAHTLIKERVNAHKKLNQHEKEVIINTLTGYCSLLFLTDKRNKIIEDLKNTDSHLKILYEQLKFPEKPTPQ